VSGAELTVATLNLENGRELELLPRLVSQVTDTGILLLQEARGFGLNGQELRRTGPKAVPAAAAPVGESHVVSAAGAQRPPRASSTGLRHAGEGPTGRRERHCVMPNGLVGFCP